MIADPTVCIPYWNSSEDQRFPPGCGVPQVRDGAMPTIQSPAPSRWPAIGYRPRYSREHLERQPIAKSRCTSVHVETRLQSEASIGGAAPSVANMQYAEVHNPSGAVTMTNMVNGLRDQMITLNFQDNNTMVQSGGNFRLAGAVNKTFTTLDTLTLINVEGVTWVEVCRSIN